MKALIISAGRLSDAAFYRDALSDISFVVCADGGVRNCEALGLVPDVIIGDFDSCPKDLVKAETVIELPTEKDRTDTHECVCYCIARGCTEILLIGGIGTRLDHTLANIHLLAIAKASGVEMKIVDEHNEIFLIENEAEIPKKEGYHLSLLPIGSAEGIYASGLYYPLENARMEFGNPYGVSNEWIEKIAQVSVKNGRLLAILSKD